MPALECAGAVQCRLHHEVLASEVIGTAPDLAILDLDLGVLGDGMPLVSALTAHGITVVVVTGSGDTLRYGEALAAGARAVLPKSTHLPTILATIHRIDSGLAVVSSTERAELFGAWRAASAAQHDIRRRFELITRREAEVLGELMNGRQVTEISRSRFVSESTVRTQVKSILAKLQVSRIYRRRTRPSGGLAAAGRAAARAGPVAAATGVRPAPALGRVMAHPVPVAETETSPTGQPGWTTPVAAVGTAGARGLRGARAAGRRCCPRGAAAPRRAAGPDPRLVHRARPSPRARGERQREHLGGGGRRTRRRLHHRASG